MAHTIEKPRHELRFLCFGAGAIGSYIGGNLFRCGQKVTFIEQPAVVASLKQKGLRLQNDREIYSASELEMTSSIEEALTHGPFDLGILAVKSFDTQALAESLRPYHAALPPILCFQNGVENEQVLERMLGKGKIIPGTVTTAIGRTTEGVIVVERKRGIGISSDHVLIPALLDVMRCADLNPVLFSHPEGMKWSKMITNLLANASSAILNMTPEQIFNNPRLFHVELLQIKETLKVMRALHIPIIDLPSTPVRLLCVIMTMLPEFLSRPVLQKSIGKGRGEKMPSFHIDLYQGRGKSEVGYLNGAVVRYAEKCGLQAPVNQFLTETLTQLTNKDLPLSTYANNPDRYYQEFTQLMGAQAR